MFIQQIDARLYPGYLDNWDDWLFRKRVREHLSCDTVLLDVGAGAGQIAALDFKALANRVCGIDPDPRVIDNPALHEAKQGAGEDIPYPDETFDVVISANVLEHLINPLRVFQEVSRVLKPGGLFIVKTPNRHHYMPLIARITPTWFHRLALRLRGSQRADADTFPTQYKINTTKAIRRTALAANLGVISIELTEGRPEYLRMSALTYLCGALYERAVNHFGCLAHYRILLIATMRKSS